MKFIMGAELDSNIMLDRLWFQEKWKELKLNVIKYKILLFLSLNLLNN